GERVTGKVVSVGSEVVFLELDGGRGEGMMDLVELRDPQGAITVAVGDVVEAVVVEAAQRGRALTLRRSVAGLRGFCPVSQLDLRPVPDAALFVGQKLAFRITRYEDDRRGPNIVLSR